MSQHALLIGSSFSAVPFFFALKRRGLKVSVCGALKDDPCHQYADQSYFVDYSDKDALTDLVRQEGFDFIVPSCNDFAYVSANWAASQLSFPGFDSLDTTLTLHTKHRFRQFCEEHTVPAPSRYYWGTPTEFDAVATPMYYPVLVKPVDSFSGRGVTKVDCPADLHRALETAGQESRSGELVIEQFVEGGLHSHTAFIEDGRIVWDGFVDEFCTVYPYQVNCSNYPSILNSTIRASVRDAMDRVISVLGLADGLLHTQFISDGVDFWIIECMRRGPGDLYPQLIERATGLRYGDMYVAKFLGERYDLPVPLKAEEAFIGRHTISVVDPVISAGFETQVEAKTFVFIPLKNSGERLDPAPLDKAGIMFFEFASREAMHRAVPRFATCVDILLPELKYDR